MALVIHAPVPIRAFSLDKPPAVVRKAPLRNKRRKKGPRDIINATEKTISLANIAHHLYYDTCFDSAIMSKAAETGGPLPDDVHGHPQAAGAIIQRRPALRRRNATRVVRTATGNSNPKIPTKAPHLNDMLQALCASVAYMMLDDVSPGCDSVIIGNKKALLKRKPAMLPLRDSVYTPPVTIASVMSGFSTLADIPEGGEEDAALATSPPPVTAPDVSSAAQLVNVVDTSYPLELTCVRARESRRSGLSSIVKNYWRRTYRPRPAARGRPALATIEEDQSLEVSPPLCGVFGYAMIRTKGKQPRRRPRNPRSVNETVAPSAVSEAEQSFPKARTTRAASRYIPRGSVSTIPSA